jgi:hypothetical protein
MKPQAGAMPPLQNKELQAGSYHFGDLAMFLFRHRNKPRQVSASYRISGQATTDEI